MGAPGLRRGAAAVALLGALLVAMFAGAAHFVGTGEGQGAAPPQQVAPDARASSTPAPPVPGATDVALEEGLARIASTPRYVATSTTVRIAGAATEDPDLYASEFVRRLLTRNYATASRDAHLAWVQAESAPTSEPLVIGLVPESARDRFAVWSVTDASAGPAPVPSQIDWTRLATQDATDAATVERVHQPAVWTNAVASGRITDPGVTAREVTATVTRTTPGGTQRFSVAVSLNLEGPPVRPAYGVVGVVTFTSIPVGPA